MVSAVSNQTWWHIFGGEVDTGKLFDGDPNGVIGWASLIAGPSKKGPEEAKDFTIEDLGYLGSYDHEPSEEEKEAWTPENYRDE